MAADLSWIIEKLKTAAQQAAAKTAQQVATKLGQGYAKAVKNFYGSYSPTPISWQLTPRTYNFMEASNWAAGENLVSGGGDKYQIELRVSTDYADDALYAKSHGWQIPGQHSKEDIISNAWYSGSHGGYGFSTPPQTIMQQEFEKIRGELPGMMRSNFRASF